MEKSGGGEVNRGIDVGLSDRHYRNRMELEMEMEMESGKASVGLKQKARMNAGEEGRPAGWCGKTNSDLEWGNKGHVNRQTVAIFIELDFDGDDISDFSIQ